MKIIIACVAALALFSGGVSAAGNDGAISPTGASDQKVSDQKAQDQKAQDQKPVDQKPVDQQKADQQKTDQQGEEKPNAHPLWTGHAEKQTTEGQVCFELKSSLIIDNASCWLCHDQKMMRDESNTPTKPEHKDGDPVSCENAAALANNGVLQHCAPDVTATVESTDVAQLTKATIPIGPSPCVAHAKNPEEHGEKKPEQGEGEKNPEEHGEKKPEQGEGEKKEKHKKAHIKGANKDEENDDEEPLATNDLNEPPQADSDTTE